mmetsp:Transcript_49885/g.132523  ORF Transcript_49885/g.132523 Transcript_49885/m.132523 type:complete len:218 (+) Transcript_49885:1149-1802(+)
MQHWTEERVHSTQAAAHIFPATQSSDLAPSPLPPPLLLLQAHSLLLLLPRPLSHLSSLCPPWRCPRLLLAILHLQCPLSTTFSRSAVPRPRLRQKCLQHPHHPPRAPVLEIRHRQQLRPLVLLLPQGLPHFPLYLDPPHLRLPLPPPHLADPRTLAPHQPRRRRTLRRHSMPWQRLCPLVPQPHPSRHVLRPPPRLQAPQRWQSFHRSQVQSHLGQW